MQAIRNGWNANGSVIELGWWIEQFTDSWNRMSVIVRQNESDEEYGVAI